ncbi:MAG: redoxin domain-containing protein [Methyloceanibacter sp.]
MSERKAVDHLRPGLALPQGSLSATDGSEVCLAALAGRSILLIYPWTGRPGLPNPPDWDLIPGAHGSTPQLEGFRYHAQEFARAGVRLLALSRQTTDYQRELVTRLKLPFPILSDADGHFAAALALPAFTTGGETSCSGSPSSSTPAASRHGSIPWAIPQAMQASWCTGCGNTAPK